MNRFVLRMAALALAAVCLTGPLAAQQGTAEVALRAAMETETVKGDLKAAIEQYKKIAAEHGKSNRPIAAQALLRMAACHEKLGDPAARALYERVVRDFRDQPDAVAVAQTRLPSRNELRNVPSSRQIWAGPRVDVTGSVSPDGRYISFVDWETGDLALQDTATGGHRRLTQLAAGDRSQNADASVISRDGKEVAYAWYNNPKFRYELRAVRLDADPAPSFRVLVDSDEIRYVAPHDWSPDGKVIAARITRADRTTQLALIGASDGAVRVLKSVDWRGPTKMAFSPDGRQIAYDLPTEESSSQRDVFVMGIDGSHDTVVAPHAGFDQVLGWAPRGDRLLFASDRSGALGLWSVPVTRGVRLGPPALLRSDLGPVVSALGVTSTGSVVFAHKKGAIDVFTADVDFSTGKTTSTPQPVGENYTWDHISPMWSQDGRHLAFQSVGRGHGAHLAIHSLDGRTTRELAPHLASLLFPRWSSDGSFIGQGVDLKGRQGLYRVHPASGEVTRVATDEGDGYLSHVSVSSDGRSLVYRRQLRGSATIVLHDLHTQAERALIQLTDLGFFRLSPDGRHVAYVTGDKARKAMSLNLFGTADGSVRELVRVSEPDRIHSNLVEWTPDSQKVLFGRDAAGRPELAVIPIAGGTPVVLDLRVTNGTVRIHPNGRRVAYSAGESSYEVWALENFLPSPTDRTPAASRQR